MMELPHCSAMWWQHSRSAGVIVAPGRTHAMAGVIAHNKAIVSSANARVLVTLISVLHFLAAMNKFSLKEKVPKIPDATVVQAFVTALFRRFRCHSEHSSGPFRGCMGERRVNEMTVDISFVTRSIEICSLSRLRVHLPKHYHEKLLADCFRYAGGVLHSLPLPVNGRRLPKWSLFRAH